MLNSYAIDLQIVEENNYYPFGLKHKGYNGNIIGRHHKYMFGGKELQDEIVGSNSFEVYDFGARNYDAALGRWMNVDPLAEKMRRHSPYNYAFNNPIYFIDPDGMSPTDIFKLNKNGLIEKVAETNSNDIIYATDENGKIDESNFVELNSDDLLNPDKSENLKNNNVGKSNTDQNGNEYNYFELEGDKKSTEVFEFLANNSSVEWGQIKFDNNRNYLSTSNNPEKEFGSADLFDKLLSKGNDVREFIHSHPREKFNYNNFYWPSGYHPLDKNSGDKDLLKWQQKWYPNSKVIYKLYDATLKKYIGYNEIGIK